MKLYEFYNVFEILKNSSNESISIVGNFCVNGCSFYICKCYGIFYKENGEVIDCAYACYFDDYDKACLVESEKGAEIIALCEYQKITGKSLSEQ